MNCPNCGHGESAAVGPYIGSHEIFRRMSLARCERCELVFAHPQPSQAELDGYYAHYWDGEVAVSTPSTRRYYLAQSLSRVDYLRQFGIFSTPPAVLDVGAGLGLFQEGMDRRGVKHDYVAVETDRGQFDDLRARLGAPNAYPRLEDVPAERKFDLVVLSHVLEHLAEPHAFLADLMQRLRKGGLLFVEVPHRDYRYKALFESHLLFFNPKSLETLLGRHGKVLDVSTVGKNADRLYVAHVHPKPDALRPLKELVKTCMALATPDFNAQQIARFEMSSYGGDRQWLRAAVIRQD
jgi:SAM-dependent methyltransferase